MQSKHLFTFAVMLMAGSALCSAQTQKSQVVENGGSGPYKAEIVSDASLPDFTVYRPQNLRDVVAREGRLPIIVYGNGGCANNNVEIRYFLNDVVSHGYIGIAVGPYDEEDFFEHWKGVLGFMGPKGKEIILANGEKFEPKSDGNSFGGFQPPKDAPNQEKGERPAWMKEGGKPGGAPQEGFQMPKQKPNRQLLDALDWIIAQNVDPESEYYHCVDVNKVAAMGQSCGGAMALAVAHDPRIGTLVILNSGIGDMSMQGVTPAQLENIHCPMLYLIGGPEDVAFGNAKKDYERLGNDIPVVMINTIDGHEGTYYEKSGGKYAIAVRKWLDWQFKGRTEESPLFLNDVFLQEFDPSWSVLRKNIQ